MGLFAGAALQAKNRTIPQKTVTLSPPIKPKKKLMPALTVKLPPKRQGPSKPVPPVLITKERVVPDMSNKEWKHKKSISKNPTQNRPATADTAISAPPSSRVKDASTMLHKMENSLEKIGGLEKKDVETSTVGIKTLFAKNTMDTTPATFSQRIERNNHNYLGQDTFSDHRSSAAGSNLTIL